MLIRTQRYLGSWHGWPGIDSGDLHPIADRWSVCQSGRRGWWSWHRLIALCVSAALLLCPADASGCSQDPQAHQAHDENGAAPPPEFELVPIGKADAVPSRHSAAYDQTRSLLPPEFREHETRRFIVLSNAPLQTTRIQARRLERTYHQFQRFIRRLGIESRPLEHKLICVLFDDREEYRAFASAHDGVSDPWIAGYYSPAHDRVVFYQGGANPSVVEARGILDRMEMEVRAIGAEADAARRSGLEQQAQALRDYQQQYQTHLQGERDRVETFAQQVEVATTLHEAFHQLMFHTGVQSDRVRYPLWISEGLATAFETDDPDSPFGPDRDYAPRRAAFEEVLTNNWLFGLRDLVSWNSVPSPDELAVYTLYHQSYALVTWLWHTRRPALREYLELMREQPAPDMTAQQYQQLFERVFGDIESLESSWLHQERVKLSERLAREVSPEVANSVVSTTTTDGKQLRR